MILKVSTAVIKNDKNEFLLLKRSPEVHNPNLWELPGGRLDKEEDWLQGLGRHIKLELNTDFTDAKLLKEIIHIHELGELHINIYSINVLNELKALKHTEHVFISKKGALKLHLTDGAREFFESLK
ncbi:NUDIX domain-containing protein [Mycoplasma phocoenae]|uniref:8-oxo-dGTP diphosphatase n=1 Tax=Mycoplasma phocoenae TaxID=754517 RepID=A0A858U721_9MOLU|nr:NUDIX domain-containing protein [Mycoplasma phocoenae]QJG67033.1 NUDIX domain-containing protein [Mycoplasma phocoenae]